MVMGTILPSENDITIATGVAMGAAMGVMVTVNLRAMYTHGSSHESNNTIAMGAVIAGCHENSWRACVLTTASS